MQNLTPAWKFNLSMNGKHKKGKATVRQMMAENKNKKLCDLYCMKILGEEHHCMCFLIKMYFNPDKGGNSCYIVGHSRFGMLNFH